MVSNFGKLAEEKFAPWMIVLACVALVVWIRTIPSSLPVAEELADRIVRQNLRSRLAPILQKLAPEDWDKFLEPTAEEWVRRNSKQFEEDKRSVADQLKAEMSFVAEDGRRYAHLGDVDSYVWLRNSRNYLRHGTTCDAIVNGECRDTYGLAPVGYRMIYNRSLHTAAIAALHKAITWFHPGYPLSASSFLVPVLVGALGIVPAFFIGRHLAGNVGGLFAAIFISLQPYFLIRSLGSDNDVWNVVLPMFILWPMIAALHARKIFPAMANAAAAGLATALHAVTWRGWPFTYMVILIGLFAHLTLSAFRQIVAQRGWRVWRAEGVRILTCVTFFYAVSSFAFGWLAGVEGSSLALPLRRLVPGPPGTAALNVVENLWPEALRTVAELGTTVWDDIAYWTGGRLLVFGGWAGLLALLIAKERWRTRHFAMLAWMGTFYAAAYYSFLSSPSYWNWLVLLIALPLGAELLWAWLEKNPAVDGERGCALIVIAWALAALAMTRDRIRLLILFAVPFGLALGVAADRLLRWFEQQARRIAPRRARILIVIGYGIVLGALFFPIRDGYRTAQAFHPAMNSAWWDTLIKIRDRSPPDAIVDTWWDYGYWVKYVGERRVSIDGGSLRTHAPHWVAKALLAPTTGETLGILRMLNCGSDATPLPEGSKGAYGKLVGMGLDKVAAYAILSDLVKLGRAQAEQYLTRRGFTATERKNILAATHCRPPESFLIINRDMIGQWLRLGTWDVRRAYLVHRTRSLPKNQAVTELVERFGLAPEEAARTYARLLSIKTDAERKEFIAPPLRVIPYDWEACEGAGAGSKMRCRMTAAYDDRVRAIDFLYDNAAPQGGRLIGAGREGSPGVIVIAGAEGLQSVEPSSPEFPDLGVLLDTQRRRVLLASPTLIRSTLVRLSYLDARYQAPFTSFDRRTSRLGDIVATWKIDWGND